jgi:hypothetical protein
MLNSNGECDRGVGAAAERAVVAAHHLELEDLGVPLDVEDLDVADAARTLLLKAGWAWASRATHRHGCGAKDARG